ncbi:MAG: bifunctional diguanylate cyclase/phosphodiesterase [Spirochaetes bacterium]|nr:bifunctional diguanylate cyclase/phosphodiesterase [Spirochaetota bacterium]
MNQSTPALGAIAAAKDSVQTDTAYSTVNPAWAALLRFSRDLVLLLDPAGCIRFAGGALNLLGYSAGALYGRQFSDLVSAESFDTGTFLAGCGELDASAAPKSPALRMLHASGQQVELIPLVSAQAGLVSDPMDSWIINLRDTSQERLAGERAAFFERYDPLTRIPNRSSFLQQLGSAITVARNRSRLFCVLSIGLDRFKRINDLYGTDVGDAVLVAVANRLQLAFRDGDILARFRGDKFFAICQDIRNHEDVKSIIAKVQAALDFQLPEVDAGLRLSASIGIAFYPNDALDTAGLIRNAETAMYMAKEVGRDNYRLYDARMNEALLDRQRIENELDGAIRSGDFEPYFQPKVDRAGVLVGVEALIRWRLPNGEIRPPAYFIPLAESNGLIENIGAIMLRKTCALAAQFHHRGLLKVPVSINLSARQFSQAGLLGQIQGAIVDNDLPPELVEFEITESSIMDNEADGIAQLKRLKNLGVSVSIDDFGTGYSSFSKLKDYPIDIIKMDKSFVDPLPDDRKATIIASAIVDLAHTLSFSVVAEGVETVDQLHFLDTIFCDSYQGYLFSKPLAAAAFEALLQQNRPLAMSVS